MAKTFQMQQFESRLQKALDSVKRVLDNTRSPSWADNVHHTYDDKYTLAEAMTNAAVSSQVNCLASAGLSREDLAKMCKWAETHSVSLRFRSEERCPFLREESREVEAATKSVTEVSVAGAVTQSLTSKVVTTVTEYFWNYDVSYELLAIKGVGESDADRISILKRTGHVELKTKSKSHSRVEAKIPAVDLHVSMGWMLQLLKASQEQFRPSFEIDRSHAKCHTPFHNPNVAAAVDHFGAFDTWADQVSDYLQGLLKVSADSSQQLDLDAINEEAILTPVLPLLDEMGEAQQQSEADDAVPGLLACLGIGSAEKAAGARDVNRLLSEEVRSLQEKRQSLGASFPSDDAVATFAEATLAMIMKHCSSVCDQWSDAVDYIEQMLRKQLVAAIGKEVTPSDFADYMEFHNRKLFADEYVPAPFCFAVRRSPNHSPEGTVSMEQEVVCGGSESNIPAPIVTLSAHSDRQCQMQFPLSASTKATFGGDTHLHAWVSHQFSGASGAKLSLVSRARQFSSMIVLVGRIVSATTFEPKHAAIVQNKDELKIPLDLSTIPTAKEFKDAIESLSSKQQEFAKAFRSMQLESTLFGVLVIQIKPQLEKVLRLPEDSLTKEIKLTQDLMQLFIKYQIPSDLLSVDNDVDGAQMVDPTSAEKLEAVKAHVGAINEIIASAKQEELDQKKQEEMYRHEREHVEAAQSRSRMASAQEALLSSARSFTGRAPMQRNMMMMQCEMAAPMAMMVADCAAPQMAVPCPPTACTASAPSNMASQAPPMGKGMAKGKGTSQQPQQQPVAQGSSASSPETPLNGERDYTQVPKEMDERFERLDTDSQLRPTIITPKGDWLKCSQKGLLASPTSQTMRSDDQKAEKDAAFDLLDALTKSGAVPIEHASLHIVVVATHCFDKSVTETVVQDNINPIEKVERSTLIMATTVHQKPAAALIKDSQLPRVSAASPALFLEDAS